VVLLALLFFFWVLLFPLARLMLYVPEGVGGLWLDTQELIYFLERLGYTFAQGLIGAIICAAIGLPSALALWILPLKQKALWARFLLLPFMLPVVVVALAMRALFSYFGGDSVGETFSMTDTQDALPWILLAGFVFYNTGLLVWIVWSALQRIPVVLLQSAQTLGANYARVLLYIVWPLVRPAVAAASTWVFLFCAGSFGLSLVLGGPQWATLEVEIYRVALRELNLPLATVLALAQGLWSALVVSTALRWEIRAYGRAQEAQTGLALDASPQQTRLVGFYRLAPPLLQACAWVCFFLISLLVLAPLLALLFASLQGNAGLTLEAYFHLVEDEDERFWGAIRNTLHFMALSLPLTALLAIATAWLTIALGSSHRTKAAGSSWFQSVWQGAVASLSYLPYVVSASILSLALLLAHPQWTGQLFLLVSAYSLLAYPMMTRQLVQAWHARDPQLYLAAQNLGAGPWRALRHGLWPSMADAWRSGLALAAATMLGEFAVTLFLSRPDWMTLSTFIYFLLGKAGSAPLSQAYAAAVMLLVLALGVFTLLQYRPNVSQT
jgi:thiamine transport system permease protein